ncbi:MAG: Plastocyanin/azurin family copper binding protein [Microgenomates group bacterium Gr01-1014_80]|nr:MAG: Plastocyanin/azurin family copper binding protein [Microgenomates group bacterium Gr01-1014_80]
MSSKNLGVAIAVIVVVALAGWFFVQSQQTAAPAPVPTTTETVVPAVTESSPSAMVEEAKVTISATGFSPKDVKIKAGEIVTWTNSNSANHAVNSSPHPVHTDYTPLNLGTIAPGTSKSLTFPTAGTYKYHDHLNPTLFGSVTVE